MKVLTAHRPSTKIGVLRLQTQTQTKRKISTESLSLLAAAATGLRKESKATMACRALALRSLLLPDPLHHLSLRAAASAPAAPFPCRRRRRNLRCCSSSSGGGIGEQGQPPQEAVLEAISKVAKSKGRVALTTNMVIGGTVTDDSSDEWLVLDQKVNTYPTDRGFTAIGTGGEDFVHSMVDAVESVLQESIPKGQVSQKISSRGKYVSVKIGPIRVASSEQVQAVYRAMRRDNRMKYFL
ncbi:hypothetical protein ACQJBY_016003 [Aegilops geniculata]